MIAEVEALAVPAGVPIVDVRESEEWAAGHVADSLHVPLMTLPQRLADLPDEPFVVVCRVGGRSAQAVAWLDAQGIESVNLAGGLLAWAGAGRELVRDDGSAGWVD